MNEYILCVLDRDNKTEEELDINANAANIAADAAAAAATDIAAAYAAYNESAYVAYAAADAAYAAWAADYADNVEYWLNEYFEATGESRGDYEIEADRRSRKKERSNG